jgi:signal transduction histidine kinase
MDNMNGRISYTGKLSSSGFSIYIELNSDILFEGIGFPELLIDKSMVKPDNYKKFNYAKYYGGELTDRYGDYNYNFHVDGYLLSYENETDVSDDEFVYNKWDGMEHLIYHTREDNYVIVSRELFTLTDYLISFPYLFVFYFLGVMLFSVIGNPTVRKRQIVFDLKFKIQAAIISIVFVSLLVVALVTIFYNIREYRERHRQDLNEKMKSISEEIDMRLEVVDNITVELEEWLHRELVKLSNIFQTDINIYGTNGNLIASSRFEIYERGLVSTRINAQAYYEVYQNFQINYFQPEKIGQLSYLSAYKPILNYKGDYLGFINLPYFIKQDNYSQEISTFIVAFINLYVLLLLASIIIAVFISNQITRPLVVIQENLKKMELGKRNEPILYNRKDEIGSLVKEYNKKVDELAVSAELLARSERESAWREMAKQIAHEIKNPLTPMKLNIQHLQRAKGEGVEYNKYIERVTATLIEQIDNLSNIATEFSNFAKLPAARNQVFNLTAQLQKVIDLFETHDQAKIVFRTNGHENLEVNADREQLSRAIINLVKNGIQAIPENKVGKIVIQLKRRGHMAVIEVADNGTGIPVELRDKLFGPSFTTKTSGMGLGLAIVKNIVENFSGSIRFETELGKGTAFFVEIPVYEKSESI